MIPQNQYCVVCALNPLHAFFWILLQAKKNRDFNDSCKAELCTNHQKLVVDVAKVLPPGRY